MYIKKKVFQKCLEEINPELIKWMNQELSIEELSKHFELVAKENNVGFKALVNRITKTPNLN